MEQVVPFSSDLIELNLGALTALQKYAEIQQGFFYLLHKCNFGCVGFFPFY